jgi:hypothetical protein
VAIFNTSEHPQDMNYTWKQLGWPARRYVLRDLWEHTESRAEDRVTVQLAAHAGALYRATAVKDR